MKTDTMIMMTDETSYVPLGIWIFAPGTQDNDIMTINFNSEFVGIFIMYNYIAYCY